MKGIKVSGLRTQRIDVGGLVDWEKNFLASVYLGAANQGGIKLVVVLSGLPRGLFSPKPIVSSTYPL